MAIKKYIDPELYEKIKENIPITTVDVILFNPEFSKTLLFYRNNNPLKDNYYSMGGRLYKGETLIECAQRKLKEEIGLDIEKNKLFQADVLLEEVVENGKQFNFVGIYFYTTLEENVKISLDSQHSKMKWFDVNDENIHPYIKQKIKRCIKNEKK